MSGSVYAIDPDIPPDRQRIAVQVVGDTIAHRVMLDARDLGGVATAPQIIAPPGRHRLRLVDVTGRIVDQVMFTIR